MSVTKLEALQKKKRHRRTKGYEYIILKVLENKTDTFLRPTVTNKKKKEDEHFELVIPLSLEHFPRMKNHVPQQPKYILIKHEKPTAPCLGWPFITSQGPQGCSH